MKINLPSLEEAAEAIGALTGQGATVKAAEGLVNIVVGLFDGKPADQDALKAQYAEAMKTTDAALDNLGAAIDEAEKTG